MTTTIQVTCDNTGSTHDVPMGTTLQELESTAPHCLSQRAIAAIVNNRLKELNYKLYTPANVRFIDATSFAGVRVYQRTASFILQRVVNDLFPDNKLFIRHSIGVSGFYCEIEGYDTITQEQAEAISRQFRSIVDADIAITRHKMLTHDVRKRYEEFKFDDKIALLDTRPRLYSDLYAMGDTVGYFYGSLAPSTGHVSKFEIRPYFNGFFFALPRRNAPDTLGRVANQEKMQELFSEYHAWVRLMGVPTVGDINTKTIEGDAAGMIRLAEAFHERKFVDIADSIIKAHHQRDVRMLLISGPSSSGKTTSAKRLGIHLAVLGLQPVLISLDDYFVDRDKTPKDESGEYDYEALEAIDIKLFNEHLSRLLQGESVNIPRYDFITGKRAWHEKPLEMTQNSILVIEGIHGLNPKLTQSIPSHQKFSIYVSCFTSIAMDNITRISTTDNRLLRRLTRDYRQRGSSALATLSRWPSVRRGEEKHIFPYQENADVMLNSSLFYEIPVLRKYAEPILREVPDTCPEYDDARRMLKFLDNFTPIDHEHIPPTSILREFIGGSSFKY